PALRVSGGTGRGALQPLGPDSGPKRGSTGPTSFLTEGGGAFGVADLVAAVLHRDEQGRVFRIEEIAEAGALTDFFHEQFAVVDRDRMDAVELGFGDLLVAHLSQLLHGIARGPGVGRACLFLIFG